MSNEKTLTNGSEDEDVIKPIDQNIDLEMFWIYPRNPSNTLLVLMVNVGQHTGGNATTVSLQPQKLDYFQGGIRDSILKILYQELTLSQYQLI